MSETKYYKLVDEDGKHLYPVEDSEGEVWGLFGDDENNQARGAARFVEVDEEDLFGYDYTYDYQSSYEEEPINNNEVDAIDVIFEVVAAAVYLAGAIIDIIDENPEIIADTINAVNRIKGWGRGVKNKIVEFSNAHFKVRLFNLKKNKPSDLEVVEMTSDIIDTALQSKENISEEEAKKLAIEMLAYYAEMKKRYDRLKAANIEGYGILQLEMEDMLKRIDGIVDSYPQLMDQSTVMQVMPILSQIPVEEREEVLECIRFDPSCELQYIDSMNGVETKRKVKAIRVKVVE